MDLVIIDVFSDSSLIELFEFIVEKFQILKTVVK